MMARAKKRGQASTDPQTQRAAPDDVGHGGFDDHGRYAHNLEGDGQNPNDSHAATADSFQVRLAASVALWRQQAAGNEDAIHLRLIGRAYEDLQRDRVRMGNRFFAYAALFKALGISPPGDEAKSWRDYFDAQTKPLLCPRFRFGAWPSTTCIPA